MSLKDVYTGERAHAIHNGYDVVATDSGDHYMIRDGDSIVRVFDPGWMQQHEYGEFVESVNGWINVYEDWKDGQR